MSKGVTVAERLEHGLLTVSEAKALLGLSNTTIFAMIADGRLESTKIGRSRRIPGRAVKALVTQRSAAKEA